MTKQTPTNTSNAEEAVRRYMLFLDDPKQLVNQEGVDKAEQAFRDAVDPIDKLKALSELEDARNVEEEPLRKAFVAVVKPWAEQFGIKISALRDLKVPDDVLREAGFQLPAKRQPGRAITASEGRQRAKAVPVDDIKAWVSKQTGTFLLIDVINNVGGSQATVRKALDEMIGAGQVSKLGPVPDYQGRGRAPLQYETKAAA